MFILYDILFFIFALAYLPYVILKRKWHKGFLTRFGSTLPPANHGAKTIWIHTVSVGEVLAVGTLIQGLRREYPDYPVVLSTVTAAGFDLAQQKWQDQCRVIYAPFDFSWVVRRYIAALNPALYISAETELWPNLFTALHRRRVPVVVVNGRISDKAFAGYRKFLFLTRRILRSVILFGMQSAEDARRIIHLGAQARRVRVVGNLKFDSLPVRPAVRKEDFGFNAQDQLLIAGSTHPGEEEIMFDIYKNLKTEFPQLRLVIAPRHVGRSEEILTLCREKGFHPAKFSEKSATTPTGDILLLDRMGYLRELYPLADVVFIGKTLCGFGGQNMLEPLWFGKPTLIGPHTENFRDIVRIFLPTGALIPVATPQELERRLKEFLDDPQKCRTVGLAAQAEITKHQGATERTLQAIREIRKH